MRLLVLILLIFSRFSFSEEDKIFKATVTKIPANIKSKLKIYSWHEGCPVPLKNLRYIRLTYWGFDSKSHLGSLIMNKELATEIVEIFRTLYEHKFPFKSMKLIDFYKSDDEASMFANNTSGFNCREVTGLKGVYSQHSYGRAIDINPQINPYVDGQNILPKNTSTFKDRKKAAPGKITADSLIYKLFIEKGWDWGGSWYDVQDYQHFEKRANGEKRNPYGYKKLDSK